jgi:hypothetical protein
MIQNTKLFAACLVSALLAGNSQAQIFQAPQSNAHQGAKLGGIAGAIIGGIAGHQNDETLGGVAIGGVVGALAGGLAGKADDNLAIQQQQYQRQAQLAYQERLGHAVSIEDAIVLSQNGVGPNLITNQILEHGVTHRLTVNDIVHLHKSGVSEAVITTMQSARLASQVPAARRVIAAPAPVVAVAPSLVVRQAIPLGIQIYSQPRYGYKPAYKPRPGHHHQYHWRVR